MSHPAEISPRRSRSRFDQEAMKSLPLAADLSARICGASLSAGNVTAAIEAILNEEMVALRVPIDRWRAAAAAAVTAKASGSSSLKRRTTAAVGIYPARIFNPAKIAYHSDESGSPAAFLVGK